MINDFRFALRQLRRNLGSTVLAILVLGLGIGAATAIFSVVDAVLLEPLPFPEPERLVRLQEVTPDGAPMSVSEPNYLDFQAASQTFEALAAVDFPGAVNLTRDAEPARLRALAVTPSFFHVLGTEPALGRNFLAEETTAGAPLRTVILSNETWQRRFNGDESLLGEFLAIDGEEHLVLGVLPADFAFPGNFEVFLPKVPDPDASREDHRMEVLGRLAPGADLEEARAELLGIAGRLAELYPETNEGYSVRLTSLREWHIDPGVERASLVLLAAVVLLLLLACANVSNLLLAQATARQAEIALRGALGAGRWQIVRQWLAESLALALLGGGLGLLLAAWAVSAIAHLGVLPLLVTVDLDREALLFSLAAALVTAIVFGLVPAASASRFDLGVVLRAVGRNGGARGERRLRDALVVGELALATTLLVGAGLLGNTFLRLLEVDPGFRTEDVYAFALTPPAERYPEGGEATARLYAALEERLAALPGVSAAGATMVWPWAGLRPRNQVAAPDSAQPLDETLPIQWRAVTPGYFETLEIALLRGRTFAPEDRGAAAPGDEAVTGSGERALPVVVNRALAHRLWLEEDPLGRRLEWGSAGGSPLEVIGLVDDIQDVEHGAPPVPMVFVPHDRVAWREMTVLLRAEGDGASLHGASLHGASLHGASPASPASLYGAVRRVVGELDPSLAVPTLEPLGRSLSKTMAEPRFYLLLMGVFAGSALILATTGIYSVLSFAVARRTREIGIRLALGARPADMTRMVAWAAARLCAAGLALGLLGAMAGGRLLEGLLFETPPIHLATYAGVAVALATVALVASWLPSRRATRVDPREAIYME